MPGQGSASFLTAGTVIRYTGNMEDPKKPLVLSAEQISMHAQAEALALVADYWKRHGVATDESPTTVVARPGSRLALRMMGVLTSFGRRRLPMIVTADASPRDTGSTITLTMTSNEGFYPMGRMRIADAAYGNRFEELCSELRSQLTT